MKHRLILLTFLLLSITLFAESNQVETVQKDSTEKTLLQHLSASVQLLLHAPDTMLFNEGGKCYIDERAIIQNEGKDYIPLKNGDLLALPQRLSDSKGSFLIATMLNSKKAFKCICNNCDFEWEGGAFTVRCPNCHSRDFCVVWDGF